MKRCNPASGMAVIVCFLMLFATFDLLQLLDEITILVSRCQMALFRLRHRYRDAVIKTPMQETRPGDIVDTKPPSADDSTAMKSSQMDNAERELTSLLDQAGNQSLTVLFQLMWKKVLWLLYFCCITYSGRWECLRHMCTVEKNISSMWPLVSIFSLSCKCMTESLNQARSYGILTRGN